MILAAYKRLAIALLIAFAIPASAGAQGLRNEAMDEESSASARDEELARQHYQAGDQLYDLGSFERAAEEFEEAYRLAPRPLLLYNVYVAHRDAGNLERATAALEAYLEAAPDAEDRVHLEARLRSMREELQQQQAQAEAVQAAQSDVEEREAALAERAEELRRQEHVVAEPREGEAWPWAMAIVGGVVLAAGVPVAIAALGEADSLAQDCSGTLCAPTVDLDNRRDTANTLALAADILIWGGAAIAATGLVLGLLIGIDEESPTASAICTPDGCVGTIRSNF